MLSFDHVSILKFLYNHKHKQGTPLHWAAGKGRTEAIKFLAEKGCDLDMISSQGLSAVLMAAVRNDFDMLCDVLLYYVMLNYITSYSINNFRSVFFWAI